MAKLFVITPVISGGGAEKMLVEYSRLAAESAVDVTLVVISKHKLTDNTPSLYPFKIHCLNKTKVVLSFVALAKYILAEKPDVVFISHLRIAFLVTFLKILRIHKGKTIVRGECLLNEAVKNKMHPPYYLWIRKFSYFFADHIIAQTDNMSQEIAEAVRNAQKKITVLYNFPSADFFNQKQSSLSNDRELSTFIFVGRLSKEKNIDLILESIAYLNGKNKHVSLNILGLGPEEEKLKAKTSQLDLDQQVNFLGYKNNPKKYIERSQALLITSHHEGLPNVLLEALWNGVPVITTRCFGNEDRYITSGQTGYICDSFAVKDYAKLMNLIVKNKQRGPWESTRSLLLNDRNNAKSFLENLEAIGGEYNQ